MIQISQLHFAYPGAPAIFKGFNWSVSEGETWAVVGASGCGKTTLLYLLAGLRASQGGQVFIKDMPIVRPRPRTGLILQDHGLLPWATVRENIRLGLEIRGFYGPDGKHSPVDFEHSGEVEELITEWMQTLGIAQLVNKYPGQLSGGQRQRTAIARTMILQPDLLLMDEPFSALDAPTRESLQSQTLDLVRDQQITLVMVTHSIEEAVWMGARILVLGEPPNIEPFVIENPRAGEKGYKDSDEYRNLSRDLWRKLDLP